jgi:peptide deformylase
MIYPIIAYGHPVLRARAQEILPSHAGLDKLIADMYETMYNAKGVGIAAPQIGLSLRIFVVDGAPIEDDTQDMKAFKRVFINPLVIKEEGEEWGYDEGCLSIPDVIEEVYRPEEVYLRYQDAQFQVHEEKFTGIQARIIQHEYDHLEGVLFTDHLGGLRKQLIKSRLKRISEGKYSTFYPMSYSQKK